MITPQGTITLIGSGEFGDAMARVYRTILSRAPGNAKAIFLDTPAGFELNADAIAAKAADYFSQRLGLTLQTASFKNKTRASARDIEAALYELRGADFIFAGPGSPSYAIRQWRDTPLWDALRNRFEHNAHLVFASAAAIAVSAFALPVYEIYKAGQDPHWIDGMNLFTALDMNLAITPHWNNTEGGTYDTRFCYMGEPRFLELEQQLPADTTVLGIDEYTACLFDLPAQECRVMGSGNVTIRCQGQQWIFANGESFPFERLRAGTAIRAAMPELQHAKSDGDASDETTLYLKQLARALDETREPEEKRTLIDRAHDTMHELAANWMDDAHTSEQENIAPYVETLIEIRQHLRAAKQFALADEIRERLIALDIVLEDSSAGTTWRKA